MRQMTNPNLTFLQHFVSYNCKELTNKGSCKLIIKKHQIFPYVLQVNSPTGQTCFVFKKNPILASCLKTLDALFLSSYSPIIL